MNSIANKTCTACGITLPKTKEFFYFSKPNNCFMANCKECSKKRVRKHQLENKKHRAEYMANYAKENREALREYARLYAHKPEQKEKRKAYRKENRVYFNQLQVKRNLENPEAARNRKRKWKERNPDKVRYHTRKRQALKRGAEGSHTREEFENKLLRYKNKCHWCTKEIKGTPHADHLIAISKGGTDNINNVVPSCAACNMSKNAKMPWDFMEGRLL